ncbi:MAG: hypothetical protein IJ325_07390, partial [Clostridia bacterium]|nr:hypothetical protein [Clostridia bacterium]
KSPEKNKNVQYPQIPKNKKIIYFRYKSTQKPLTKSPSNGIIDIPRAGGSFFVRSCPVIA